MAGVDPFLRSEFEFLVLQQSPDGQLPEEQMDAVRAPMLLRVTEEWSFDSRDIYPGLEVTARIGDVIAGTGSLRTLNALMQDPAIISISSSRLDSGPECGQSVPFVGANMVHDRPDGEEGNHAILAIIDFGIDVLHPSFQSASGATRIVAYWDQTDDSVDMSPLVPYGRVFSSEDINRINLSKTPNSHCIVALPSDSHGTHVASIAAGKATGDFEGGVAPESFIIGVRLRRSKEHGSAAEHIAAVSFVKLIAERLGLPVIINLSLGISGGARDGQTDFERALENATSQGAEPGVVIVTSAGNQYDQRRHVEILVRPNATEAVEWETEGGSGRTQDAVEFWIEPRADISFMVLYNGQPLSAHAVTGQNADYRVGDGNIVRVSSLMLHHENGMGYILVSVGSAGGKPIHAAKLKLILQNSSAFESLINGWIDHTRYSRAYFLSQLSSRITLTSPACAENVISVGACSADNPAQLNSDSSSGPTLDERNKPDLVAPGQQIRAAASGKQSKVTEMSGSSQAAAHVAGAAALLMSRSKKVAESMPGSNMRPLSARQLRSLLRSTTNQSSGHWHPRLGYGVLDVKAAFSRYSGA